MSFKFNPLTGAFDLVGQGTVINKADNFSILQISQGVKKTVPTTQQMILSSECVIDGDLIIDGQFVELGDDPELGIPEFISEGKNVLILAGNQIPFYDGNFIIDGNLILDGRLLEI